MPPVTTAVSRRRLPRRTVRTGLACSGIAATFTVSLAAAPGAVGLLGAWLGVLMTAIAISDARRFVIPDSLSAAALVLGLAHAGAAATVAGDAAWDAVAVSVARAAVVASLFLALQRGYARLRGREGLGLGDVKLMGVAGAWLDWTTLPTAVAAAAMTALATVALAGAMTGRSPRAAHAIPFGAFLAPAIWVGWLSEAVWLWTGV